MASKPPVRVRARRSGGLTESALRARDNELDTEVEPGAFPVAPSLRSMGTVALALTERDCMMASRHSMPRAIPSMEELRKRKRRQRDAICTAVGEVRAGKWQYAVKRGGRFEFELCKARDLKVPQHERYLSKAWNQYTRVLPKTIEMKIISAASLDAKGFVLCEPVDAKGRTYVANCHCPYSRNGEYSVMAHVEDYAARAMLEIRDGRSGWCMRSGCELTMRSYNLCVGAKLRGKLLLELHFREHTSNVQGGWFWRKGIYEWECANDAATLVQTRHCECSYHALFDKEYIERDYSE